jgi:hypothetical protein
LLKWFEENGRDLPWRDTKDPYAIWLSEVILQQTRIQQGYAYWEKFMQRFPTVKDLAADQFGIYSGSDPGNYQAAFFVYNGQVFIRSAFIQDGSVDNAKIGNFIQSNNYVAGQSGWKLDKGGTWENYGSDGQGARKTTNVTDSIRDAKGVLRVQIGKLTGVF